MKLNFLGRGAAFNPKEGNTSAYFIDGSELFLIDCGENIYERIIQKNILNGIQTINVMITHMHPDHIGSLGTLIFHSYFVLKNPVNIIVGRNTKYVLDLEYYLAIVGCTKDMYKFVYIENLTYNKTFSNMHYFPTTHCNELDSYGIGFYTPDGIIYYSGDTNDLETIKCVLELEDLYALYVDCTSQNYPGNVHLYIGLLNSIVPEDKKNKIYCMHFNNDECIRLAKEYGFNVVEVVK